MLLHPPVLIIAPFNTADDARMSVALSVLTVGGDHAKANNGKINPTQTNGIAIP